MIRFLKDFWQDESGMETIEVVVIIAVLVAIALIFRKAIVNFVGKLTQTLFSDSNAKDWTDPNQTPQ